VQPDRAWTDDFPTRQLLPITGLLAFYNERATSWWTACVSNGREPTSGADRPSVTDGIDTGGRRCPARVAACGNYPSR